MTPADKRSQFKAPHMNNIYKQYCSHIVLDTNYTCTYKNIMKISTEVFSRVSTMHK